jgi:hypothetical protein
MVGRDNLARPGAVKRSNGIPAPVKNDRMTTGQRFWLILFAMAVGGCGTIVVGDPLWVNGASGEAGMGRASYLYVCIAPAIAIGCGLVVAYLTRDRGER